jgi:hypothetical protein
MRALSADREPVGVGVGEHDWLAKGVAAYKLTRRDTADLDSFGEVRPGQLIGLFAHFRWSSRFCARSRWATNAGATFVTAQRVDAKMRISKQLVDVELHIEVRSPAKISQVLF